MEHLKGNSCDFSERDTPMEREKKKEMDSRLSFWADENKTENNDKKRH